MRVLVTGAGGMLGTDVCLALADAGHEAVAGLRNAGRLSPAALGESDCGLRIAGQQILLDVTDLDACRRVVGELRPDAVIHCAAYTNVDGAEREPEEAYRVNGLGSWAVAAACAEHGVPMCAIGTDFVFDGEKGEPYVETDRTNPLGVYGASKLAGEQAVRESGCRYWIVRTSWLFGAHGKCFPDTILRAAEARPELRVVADQRGTPTFTKDLAAALVRLIQSPLYGTYHIANSGVTSWYYFAREALRLAGNTGTRVIPITSAEWPSPARRPTNSALRCRALEMQGAPMLRPWREALDEYARERRTSAAG